MIKLRYGLGIVLLCGTMVSDMVAANVYVWGRDLRSGDAPSALPAEFRGLRSTHDNALYQLPEGSLPAQLQVRTRVGYWRVVPTGPSLRIEPIEASLALRAKPLAQLLFQEQVARLGFDSPLIIQSTLSGFKVRWVAMDDLALAGVTGYQLLLNGEVVCDKSLGVGVLDCLIQDVAEGQPQLLQLLAIGAGGQSAWLASATATLDVGSSWPVPVRSAPALWALVLLLLGTAWLGLRARTRG